MYNNLANLCNNWNLVIGICNGRDGPHTPENEYTRQILILNVFSWFIKWKTTYATDMAKDNQTTTKYNFFVDKMWFYIRASILLHIGAIQIYCINKGEKANLRNLNIGVVEWMFSDSHQSVGGITNKMMVK